MALFNLNDRVCYKSNVGVRGRVSHVHPPQSGKQFYNVIKDSGEEEIVGEDDLQKEVIAHTAWDYLANNSLLDFYDFGNSTVFYKVTNNTSNTISTLKASRTQFKPYQFKPLVKFLNSDTKRILIADEVGLGKTIEAGHIMLELLGRGLLRNALVICSKSLQYKWQIELLDKFNLDFKIFEAKALQEELRSDIHQSAKTIKGIINYEKLLNKGIVELIEKSNYQFDLIICDEAHKLKNPEAKRHNAFKVFQRFAESILFLTATPIMLGIDDLYNLVNLLEEDRYFSKDVFRNAISLNRPFINALNQLNRKLPLPDIKADLETSIVTTSIEIGDEFRDEMEEPVDEIFKDDPLYQRVKTLLTEPDDNYTLRAKIQRDLTELNSLNHLFTRSRKRDVQTEGERVIRNPRTLSVTLNEDEVDVYNKVMSEYGGLAAIMKKRQVTSCIPVFKIKEEDLLKGILPGNCIDSKFSLLQDILNKVVEGNGKKLIIFSFFRKTLLYLKIRIEALGIGTEMIHGQIQDRHEHIDNFRANPKVQVFLSSEVGSEGLDLQFCDALVNYDLPWNPMVVEQRIGRIDRVGQKSSRIHIYTLLLKGTIEERIYHRLLDRINVFRESLGDLEEILGEEETLYQDIKNLECDLYTQSLSEEEQNNRIDQVAFAIEKEKLTLQDIEKELTDALVYDIHFKNEIDRIVSNNHYLSEIELIRFTESLFRQVIPTCNLVRQDEHIHSIEVPKKSVVIFEFIESNLDNKNENREILIVYRKFKSRFYGEQKIKVTFNQEFAFENPNVEYINSYHPLIVGFTNYLKQKRLHVNQAYRIGIPQLDVQHLGVNLGHYIIAIYKITVEKFDSKKRKEFHYLHAIVADLNGSQLELLDPTLSDQLYGLAQTNVKDASDKFPFTHELVQAIKSPISMKIIEKQTEIEEEEKLLIRSSIERRKKIERQFYENKIKRVDELLKTGRGIKDILLKQKKVLEDTLINKIDQLEQVDVKCKNDIISINHLEIF